MLLSRPVSKIQSVAPVLNLRHATPKRNHTAGILPSQVRLQLLSRFRRRLFPLALVSHPDRDNRSTPPTPRPRRKPNSGELDPSSSPPAPPPRIMSQGGHTIEVTNLSPDATERVIYDFFSFSGAIEHIEIIRSGEYGSTAYVTFRDPHALETAVLLSGATILDQRVCIVRWGQSDETSNFWDRSWSLEDDNHSTYPQTSQFTTPREAVTMAQEVVKTMLAKGYILGKDALIKAKAFDESHQVSATAAAKVADLSRRIGLTDKISYSVDTVRSVDERYGVLDTTKTAVAATAKTASSVARSVVNSSYFSAGALWVSDALTRAAKAAADLSNNANRQ